MFCGFFVLHIVKAVAGIIFVAKEEGIWLQWWQGDKTRNIFHSGIFSSFVKYWDRRTEQSRCVVVFKRDDINFLCHLSVFHQAHPLTQHKSCSGRNGRFHEFAQDFTLGGTQLSGTVQTHLPKAQGFGPGRKMMASHPGAPNYKQNAHIESMLQYFKNYIVNIQLYC